MTTARCECGATFTAPAAAAAHRRESGHLIWSIPAAWLAGRPWSPAEFWRTLDEEAVR